jgi:hypothetical protein
MRKSIFPIFLGVFVFVFGLAHDTQAAPVRLHPGSYILKVQITRGDLAGTALAGTCSVTAKALTYSLKLPRGSSPSKTSGKSLHNGKSSFVANSDVGKIRITVKNSNSKAARGVFASSDSSGTWTLTRR